ncbi:MAG: UdgX family uracil-DNA binding protein [Paracoccaceae bacterium]
MSDLFDTAGPSDETPGEPPRPETHDALLRAAAECRRCPLWEDTTQVVVSDGTPTADLMFVGEQPGDKEDLAGKPFVGPAGQLFDIALSRVGIERQTAYVTNAVKHFKHFKRGSRRIHEKPGVAEIDACRWWLDAERRIVRPKLIVALGASGARGVTKRQVTISRERGVVRALDDGPEHVMITIHPSALLRIPDDQPAKKRTEWYAFLGDLETARDWLAKAG